MTSRVVSAKLLAAAVILMPTAAVAVPPVRTGVLQGLAQVDFLVEDLSGDAARCGLDVGQLDAAARFPLSISRLRIAKDALSYVYVRVTVLHLRSDSCVASVSLSLRRWASEWTRPVQVWEKASLDVGPEAGFDIRVRQSVEDFAKNLVTDWTAANPQ